MVGKNYYITLKNKIKYTIIKRTPNDKWFKILVADNLIHK